MLDGESALEGSFDVAWRLLVGVPVDSAGALVQLSGAVELAGDQERNAMGASIVEGSQQELVRDDDQVFTSEIAKDFELGLVLNYDHVFARRKR